MTLEQHAEIPRTPSAAAVARRHVERRLAGRVPGPAIEKATLIVSELVTNAYVHGVGRIRLEVDVVGDRLRVEVVDEGTGQVPTIRDEAGETGGFGLRLVDALALEWGAFEGTTHVWAELPLD